MIPDRPGLQRFYGKYRGKVLENIDPLGLARLLVDVAAVPSAKLAFALPCVPYAGMQVGFLFLPPIGANVWVEFEEGDPKVPIWTGCFWVDGELPLGDVDPMIKILKTEGITLTFNDTPEAGSLSIFVEPPSVSEPLEMIFDSAGIQILVSGTSIVMTPEGIAMTGDATIEVTAPEINVAGNTTVEAEATVEVTSPEVSVTANVTVEGPVEIEGNLEVTGAVEIEGNVEVTGAVEIEGDMIVNALDIALNALAIELDAAGMEFSSLGLDINAAMAINGIVEVDGDLLIDGQQPVVI